MGRTLELAGADTAKSIVRRRPAKGAGQERTQASWCNDSYGDMISGGPTRETQAKKGGTCM